MKKILLLGLLMFSTFAVGCKQPPLEEIASAEAAIQAAREAQAEEYATETFNAAENKLAKAYREIDAEEYDLARANAIGARELAEAALREARKRKQEDAAFQKKEKDLRAEKGQFDPEIEETVEMESATGAGVASRDLQPILFDFDSYTIREDQRATLDDTVKWLLEHDDLRIRLEGHTDERGEAEYNLALGRRRALAVKDDLISAGIRVSRIQTVSLGEEDPVDDDHTEAAWAKNRRVTVMLLRPNESVGTN